MLSYSIVVKNGMKGYDMVKKYLLIGLVFMILSMILFAIGFTCAVLWGIKSNILFPILILLAILLLAIASVFVFLGITKGDYNV